MVSQTRIRVRLTHLSHYVVAMPLATYLEDTCCFALMMMSITAAMAHAGQLGIRTGGYQNWSPRTVNMPWNSDDFTRCCPDINAQSCSLSLVGHMVVSGNIACSAIIVAAAGTAPDCLILQRGHSTVLRIVPPS